MGFKYHRVLQSQSVIVMEVFVEKYKREPVIKIDMNIHIHKYSLLTSLLQHSSTIHRYTSIESNLGESGV